MNEIVQDLLERILEHAAMVSEDLNKDNNRFNQGLAQAYSEVLDIITYWSEANSIGLPENLREWAKQNLQ